MSRLWFLLAASLLAYACSKTQTTPPDTTPVYEKDATAGLSPVQVERLSVDEPEAEKLQGAAGAAGAAAD